jgi:hypothetical protein
LDKERAALARWQTKLKRAFNAVEKSQKRVARIERKTHSVVANSPTRDGVV